MKITKQQPMIHEPPRKISDLYISPSHKKI